MKRVQGNNLKINVAVWKGRGKTVLCIHGITANCRSWDLIAQSLVPEYEVMAIDLRGRGLSDKPNNGYSVDHHIKDIVCLLDDQSIDKVILMGHSLGAFVSLAFAARHPERVEKLIIVDGAGELSTEQMDHVFSAIKPALDRLSKTFASIEEYLEEMKSAPYIHPWSQVLENYYRYEIEEVAGGVRTNINPKHILEESENVRKIDPPALYNKIACKTLILNATQGLVSQDDLLLPEDTVGKMIREIPHARQFAVMGVNHYGIVLQPHKDRDDAIRAFLGK